MGKVFHVDHQIANKNVEDSITEWTKVIKYSDINSENRLFGGLLMSWIDEVAGTVALRHSGNPVATAAIDNMQFKQGAVLNDIVVIIGKITHVGKTSMEVRVDTYVEDKQTGMRHVLNRASLTEVCIDEDNTPVIVPYGLNVRTESEKAEWQGAERRRELRRQRRMEGF
jgi:acyl-CoA hydrolase